MQTVDEGLGTTVSACGTEGANRTAASLMKTSRPRRQHFSERGLPLCLITFRAFLQLSFLNMSPVDTDRAHLLLKHIKKGWQIRRTPFVQFEKATWRRRDRGISI